MKGKQLFSSSVLSSLLSCPAVWAASESSRATVSQLFSLFAAGSDQVSNEKKFTRAQQVVDYKYIAEQAIGSSNWSNLSPDQRQQLQDSLKGLMESHYYPRWYRFFHQGKLTYVGEQHLGGDTLVLTKLQTDPKTTYKLNWRMHRSNQALRLASLSVDDVDLLHHLHWKLQKQISKRGVRNVIAGLKDQVNDARADAADATTKTQ